MIIFLPISLNICFGAQKNRLIDTVLLSIHNICLVEKQEKQFSGTHSYPRASAKRRFSIYTDLELHYLASMYNINLGSSANFVYTE